MHPLAVLMKVTKRRKARSYSLVNKQYKKKPQNSSKTQNKRTVRLHKSYDAPVSGNGMQIITLKMEKTIFFNHS